MTDVKKISEIIDKVARSELDLNVWFPYYAQTKSGKETESTFQTGVEFLAIYIYLAMQEDSKLTIWVKASDDREEICSPVFILYPSKDF